LTRVVGTPVGRRPPAVSADGKVEILGVAGAGKSTVAGLLGQSAGFEMAEFIHARQPSHLLEVARAIPRLSPILLGGIARGPRISWSEVKLLVYVTRWRQFLRRRAARPGTVLLFDQGPLYAQARLQAEGKPFTSSRAFQRWRDRMVEDWTRELSAVVWLDAPDAVLWSRINERPKSHKTKGQETGAGHRFIVRYRGSFQDLLRRVEVSGGPRVIRLQTSPATAEEIVRILRPLLVARDHGADRPVARRLDVNG
jgi:hypothetical protein